MITSYFLDKNIPGKIVEEPFKNFCHNRNFALKACIGMSDFVLLMDADMMLQILNFNKNNLVLFDSFRILQGNDNFYYQNTRIVRNNGMYDYKGVTHEYLNTPPTNTMGSIIKSELFILDIGDGGSKQNKFERDIGLLTQGILDEPLNERYYFYLANSYFDHGDFEKAIEIYKKRIDLKGWNQEVWYSYYRTGLCYKSMGRIADAVFVWLNAYDYLPCRVENLYEIVKHYRDISKHKLSDLFYKLAIESIKKTDNQIDHFLFLQKDIYDFKLDYEYSIIASYVGIKCINNQVISILNKSNDHGVNRNLLSNMKFYKNILNPLRTVKLDETIHLDVNGENTKFLSSSSCLLQNPGDASYFLNVRYVNYFITDKGGYIGCDKHIITHNKYVELSYDFETIREKHFDVVYEDRRYIGIEDIRIFEDLEEENIKFIGIGLLKNNKIGMVCGNYDPTKDALQANELSCSFKGKDCEKNWSAVNYQGSTHIVYSWCPLRICKINFETNCIEFVKEIEMPKIFSDVRGSTSGFKYNKEIWFVAHLVSYESPRHYYHLIVVFDENMKLLRYSAPFKFEGDPIEFCLSIIVEDAKVLINYSTWDRTTRIGIYHKTYIDSVVKYF